MSRLLPWIGVGVVAAAGAAPAPAQSAQACDRACLRTMLDQYLAAVIKHDPAAAPLVVGFRQTENAINVRPGNGVWKTVTGLGKVQRRYLDPVSGQAGFYGTVRRAANRDRHRPRAGREPQAHRSGVVHRARQRSGAERPAPAGRAAGQPPQPRISHGEPAARSRRAAQPALGSRHARGGSSTATSTPSPRMTARWR